MDTQTKNQRAEHIWLGERISNESEIQNLDVVSRIWNEIWNKGELDASDEVFTKDYLGHLPIMTVHGPEEFRESGQGIPPSFSRCAPYRGRCL